MWPIEKLKTPAVLQKYAFESLKTACPLFRANIELYWGSGVGTPLKTSVGGRQKRWELWLIQIRSLCKALSHASRWKVSLYCNFQNMNFFFSVLEGLCYHLAAGSSGWWLESLCLGENQWEGTLWLWGTTHKKRGNISCELEVFLRLVRNPRTKDFLSVTNFHLTFK